MWWWWCDDEVMMMWCVVSWKTLNTRRKNQDGALMFVTMFLYNYNYPTTTTGWGWTWTSSHQPPVHVQGWSRLNNQILLTSKIVNWTFTKRGKGSKSANNQNSFGAWCWLCAVTQWSQPQKDSFGMYHVHTQFFQKIYFSALFLNTSVAPHALERYSDQSDQHFKRHG